MSPWFLKTYKDVVLKELKGTIMSRGTTLKVSVVKKLWEVKNSLWEKIQVGEGLYKDKIESKFEEE